MKKIFLITFLGYIFFAKGQTNTYHPFPTSHSTWSEAFSGGSGNSNTEYGLFGDSIFGTYTYHKLYIRSITPCFTNDTMTPQNSSLFGAIMEDNMKRVYYRPFYGSCGDSVLKLYDFSRQTHGDTILFDTTFSSCYAYTYLTIDSIDSVLVHSNYRKRIYFVEQGETWIEGVGSLRGLLSSVSPYLTCSCIEKMVCNMQNGSLYYFNYNPSYGGYLNYCLCNYPLHIDEINEKVEIKIYPNPANSVIQISINNYQAEEIKIYDMLGHIVIKNENCKIKQGGIQMDVSSLLNGMYYLKIGNNTQKFVVQH